MFDKELAIEILQQIYQATLVVLKRFEPINSSDDFIDSENGMEKLDSICMQLIAIGESLKNLDNVTENNLLKNYSGIDWKKVKGMRDIISHHYFDIDAEAIFDVCQNHIPILSEAINKIITDIR